MSDLIKTINLGFTSVSLRSDGLIENRFLWDTPYEITAEKLIEIDQAIKTLSNNQKTAILSVPGLYGSMTPEARKVPVFDDVEHTLAIALVIQSLSQRLLANFYFKVNKVPYPVKFFKTEKEALSWLYQEVRKNQMAG